MQTFHVNFTSSSASSGYIGAPVPSFVDEPTLSNSTMPIWHFGPSQMFSGVLTEANICHMFTCGPAHIGCFWGESPLLMSKEAMRTALLVRLHCISKSISEELVKRKIERLNFSKQLFLAHDDAILCMNAHGTVENSRKLTNVANLSSQHSSGATIHGGGVTVAPRNFGDNASRFGGVGIFLPLVNAAHSSKTLASALGLIRAALWQNHANLEAMQSQGGYRTLALLLRQKRQYLDIEVLDACFAIAVDGFGSGSGSISNNADYLLVDWDAMKYLLLNHQVWDIRIPSILLAQLKLLNSLVSTDCINASFNARGLYSKNIVEWSIHLMLEASTLYKSGEWGNVVPPTVSMAAIGVDAKGE